MKALKKPLVNSSIAFVLAGLTATTLHELAHFATALAVDGSARLTPGSVALSDTITSIHIIMAAAAGPLFSLISGLIIIFVARNWGNGFMRLFWSWLGFLSAQIGFGYLLISSFAQGGDTGLVLKMTHANWFAYGIVTAIGAIGTYLVLPKLFSADISRYVKNKKEFFQLGMYPWLLGSTGLLAIYLIIEGVMMHHTDSILLSLLGTATIGIFVPLANYDSTAPSKKLVLGKLVLPLVVTIGFASLLIFGLSKGLTIG